MANELRDIARGLTQIMIGIRRSAEEPFRFRHRNPNLAALKRIILRIEEAQFTISALHRYRVSSHQITRVELEQAIAELHRGLEELVRDPEYPLIAERRLRLLPPSDAGPIRNLIPELTDRPPIGVAIQMLLTRLPTL